MSVANSLAKMGYAEQASLWVQKHSALIIAKFQEPTTLSREELYDYIATEILAAEKWPESTIKDLNTVEVVSHEDKDFIDPEEELDSSSLNNLE